MAVRTYAVRLEPGRYGPEFNSIPEASRWGFENLAAESTASRCVVVAFMRDGSEIHNCVVTQTDGNRASAAANQTEATADAHHGPQGEQLPGASVISKRTWIIVVLAVLLATGAWGVRSYARGGGHLELPSGYTSGPVTIGDEFHLLLDLYVEEDPIELRSLAVTSTGDGEVDVRLVRLVGGAPGGSFTGPLPDDYEVVPVRGHEISGDPSMDGVSHYALDVRVVADAPGPTGITEVAVDYDAGRFRSRRAVVREPLCVRAVTDMATEGPRSETAPPAPWNDECR